MLNTYQYILLTFIVATLIRVLPVTLIRRQIKNRFIRSFLYYVPYVTLAVMTFPAIIDATNSQISGILALVAGVIAAYLGLSLFPVSVICCLVVLIAELFL